MSVEDRSTLDLIGRARRGDKDALDELLSRDARRLKLMVRMRLSPRLRSRLDEDDVLQEAYLDAAKRLDAYLEDPQVSFFLWLRQIVKHRLLKVHREHLGLQIRDARREAVRASHDSAMADSVCLAERLIGNHTSPSDAAVRSERRIQLERAIESMSELDRETLCLRNFEQMSNQEAAAELGVDESTASKRYVRALIRLEKTLVELGLANDDEGTPKG
ncbi:MAG: sigma-70 family RNA polymerase sigma factor [Rubripirellula sp.]